jgi:multiple sugar transport system permease protein
MERSKRRLAYILIIPAIIIVLAFIVYPVVDLFRLSFTDRLLTDPSSGNFVGLESYKAIFSDEVTFIALKNTLIYVALGAGVTIIIGLLLGQLLSINRPITRITSGLILIPWAMPPVIIATTWKWMMHPQLGAINDLLKSLNIIERPIAFLSTPSIALLSVIAILVWRLFPLEAILISAGIQTIPQELHEAALVDGATNRQRFFYITIPSIKFIILTTALMNTLWILNSIALVLITTQGGPLNYTELLTTLIYKTGFKFYKFGEASALAVFNFGFILVLSLVYLFIFRDSWRKVLSRK